MTQQSSPNSSAPNPSATPDARPRKTRTQAVLSVLHTHNLGPHLIRVVLGGDGFGQVNGNDFTDKYVKITFVDPVLGLTPPFDLDALRGRLEPEQLPVRRTYTVRKLDAEARELTIDFVVHGEEGVAGPWARAARPGDLLSMSGAGGGYAPDLTADWHLFVGDDTAVPAISSALEALPDDARGLALIEIDHGSDEVPVEVPVGVEVRWLHRDGAVPGKDTLLVPAVEAMDWPAGRVQVFAHGERESMKGLRKVFADRGVPRSDLSLSGYWAYGRAEDQFQAEKRQPVGKIFED